MRDHGFEPRQLFLESRQTRAEIAVAGEASSWPRAVSAEWNEWATTRQRIGWPAQAEARGQGCGFAFQQREPARKNSDPIDQGAALGPIEIEPDRRNVR